MPPHDGSDASPAYMLFEDMLAVRDDERQGEKKQQDTGREKEGVAQGEEQQAEACTVDDFAPVHPVGNGDMGTVFLVAHQRTRAAYAMKVMKKEVLKRRDTFFRADLERDILASLNHPFLPKLFTHFETQTHRFLVMNYCAGGDLNVLRQSQAEKSFSESAARFYASEVVLALEYLHEKGIIYRDLKPENILVQEDGHIMLADFDLSARMSDKYVTRAVVADRKKPEPRKRSKRGLSKMFTCAVPGERTRTSGIARVTPLEILTERDSGHARSHSFVGTEEYVAPEMVWGTGHGKAVDWWALGILLYEMVWGKTPFKGDNRKSTFVNILCKDVVFPGPWSPLKDLVEKLLIKDPTKRLGSANGAAEVKSHCFFDGVNWDVIQFVSRPPHVPPPFSLEEAEAKREMRLVPARVEGDDSTSRNSAGDAGSLHAEQDKRLATRDVGRDAADEELSVEGESWTSSPLNVSQDKQFFELPESALRPTTRHVDTLFDDTF